MTFFNIPGCHVGAGSDSGRKRWERAKRGGGGRSRAASPRHRGLASQGWAEPGMLRCDLGSCGGQWGANTSSPCWRLEIPEFPAGKGVCRVLAVVLGEAGSLA